MKDSPILIIGKNAKTGWRVERRLEALGYPTRAVSRSTSPAFDWEDQGSWREAMSGGRSAYVTFHPDLAIPGAEQGFATSLRLPPNSACSTWYCCRVAAKKVRAVPNGCSRKAGWTGMSCAPTGSCRTSARAS